MTKKRDPEQVVREIKRKTRRKFSAEEKIRIVLESLRGEETIAELCRREGISPNLYYNWSKEFLEAGKRRLMSATTVSRRYPTRLLNWTSNAKLSRKDAQLWIFPPSKLTSCGRSCQVSKAWSRPFQPHKKSTFSTYS